MANITTMQAVAKLQCTFIDYVIKPYFSALAVVFPALSVQIDLMASHRKKWQTIAEDDDAKKIPFPPPQGLDRCGSYYPSTSQFANSLSTHQESTTEGDADVTSGSAAGSAAGTDLLAATPDDSAPK
jgi:hypothetical protein